MSLIMSMLMQHEDEQEHDHENDDAHEVFTERPFLGAFEGVTS